MSLLLDYRSGSKDLALLEPVRSLLDICPQCNGRGLSCSTCYGTGRQLCTLSSGDISFTGNGPDGPILIGIELKRISDLISSIFHGRLQDTQLGSHSDSSGMLNTYDENWILYYGRYRKSPKDGKTLQIYKTKEEIQKSKYKDRYPGFYDYIAGKNFVSYKYLESFLCSPSVTRRGILVKHVEDLQQAADWIEVLYNIWQKEYSKHGSMRAVDRSAMVPFVPGMDEKTYIRFLIAGTLPGLRDARALAVTNHFSSTRAMINASEEELAEITTTSDKGRKVRIGPVIAKNIVNIVS